MLDGDPETAAQRRDHLQRLKWLVETFDGFHLALVDIPPDPDLFSVYWAIKEGSGVNSLMLEGWAKTDKGFVERDVELRHPQIVRAFRRYFDEIWRKLPAECTDRRSVIDTLQRAIDSVGV